MDVEDSNDLDSNNSSNGEDDSDGDDDFGDPGPFHSTGIDESSLNLHLSDSTIISNESSDQPQPSTSFGAWRQRKRTDSTNVNDSENSTPRSSFTEDSTHKNGSKPSTFSAESGKDNTAGSSSGQDLGNDDVFVKPQDTKDSRDRSARAARSKRQVSPPRTTSQRPRQTPSGSGQSAPRRPRSRSRSNMREDLSQKFSGNNQTLACK